MIMHDNYTFLCAPTSIKILYNTSVAEKLVYKHYVNGVTLIEQNPFFKCCQAYEPEIYFLKAFHRGTVGLCRSAVKF